MIRSSKYKKSKILIFVMVFCVVLLSSGTFASALPNIGFEVTANDDPQAVVSSIQIVILLSILTLAPSILIMMTCFTRFIIVFSFLRKALSLQTTPPNQVIIGLALFMTFFVMAPVFSEVNENAVQPYISQEISQEEAFDQAVAPVKSFMLRQVRSKDLALFINLSGDEVDITTDEDYEKIGMTSVIPAFMLSEIKRGFEIGFMLFIPFIVIDMVVASTLMALGMMMLPPVMISLPFKILIFILVDGWNLIVQTLITSIR
ncbi:MAG: flagellar type III secretion system pore protein FliP [Firmicutes bacterium]|jgi:flagellar biosynthetic protein FliP|nr:flagellar type III secretion system pore protein FliP [Bacillota bacterium]